MTFLLIFLLILAVIACLLALMYKQDRVTGRRKPASSKNGAAAVAGSLVKLQNNASFWGAEITQPGCTEAYNLLGQRLPFIHIPRLPLEGCTREACTCQFKGLLERRKSHRRLSQDRRGEIRFDKSHPDRRKNAGRRRGDLWVNHAL